jgi:hypothetical protein
MSALELWPDGKWEEKDVLRVASIALTLNERTRTHKNLNFLNDLSSIYSVDATLVK